MEGLWPLGIVVVVGIALVLVYASGPRLFAGHRPAARSFWCPFRRTDVEVEFKETVWDGRFADVRRCTAFAPPTRIECDKGCRTLRHFPARGGLPAEAGAVSAD